MSLCHCFKRRWDAFKNIVYGYDEAACRKNKERRKKRNEKDQAAKHVHFSRESHATSDTRRVFQEYKQSSETERSNYCIPKSHTKYEAYGIEFDTRQDRDAFECKMESMERILEKELYDIKQQHIRLKKRRFKTSFLGKKNKDGTNPPQMPNAETCRNTWLSSTSESDSSTFLPTDNDHLIEEISLVNELQDVYEHMCHLSKELKNIEKVLKIEVRERTLHPEPRLIHIKVPEDEFSQQMKSDGGLRYCSSDSSVQQISYETLPPPLALSDLLASESQDDT